ncbi:hypothetical protein B5E64_05815 [Drancourtella sp. An12]|uniref:hypothetical protein n=1 Tax=Drancourtella sp. An12 TaxID=1965548 RepID=UPI000B376050|nr:hypothetical protein [Drancourtella sp. An12]OUQ46275.1 hypothetical protein B5E64_05815 [Drancourtella sp. An12]
MTKEQRIFYVGLKKLDQLDRIKEERNLTYGELKQVDDIKAVLFGTVRSYGIDLAKTMTKKYRLPSDCFADLCQDMAIIFFEKYRDYDPTRTTPTTYFVRYFKQVISEYLMKNIHKLSQYDAANVLKIRRAVAAYEEQGVQWTEEMLANKTGLSLRVVRSTLYYAYASNYAPIEEACELKSRIKTPEESLAEKESQEALIHALKEHTTEEELDYFLLRVNLNGPKELPYEKIAEMKNVSVREAKRKVNSCITHINQDRRLVEQFSVKTYKTYQNTLRIQPDTASILEEQFADCFSEGTL